MHGDIKPDNLLITLDGTVKIGDFSVSQVFEVINGFPMVAVTFEIPVRVTFIFHLQDENDELRRSPGTPVFTAPECCLGLKLY